MYRTHTCGELNAQNVNQEVKIAGWIHRKRDFGNLCFVDLRDNYGITQIVFEKGTDIFNTISELRVESVIGIDGNVVKRESANANIPTGEIEVIAKAIEVHSKADVLPIQVAQEDNAPEELRLKYRFLDLRKERLRRNMYLRAKVIKRTRELMIEQGFTEFQTPILTASSPEGARDFLVPSRINPGMFYALPQAPQQFKQLLMVSGFDKYFQIAPCFRDEDPRADRSPGEFYQMDMEMSFVTQEDVFRVIEKTLGTIFNEFAEGRSVDQAPYLRIPFKEAMNKYGSDKPDLRNPLTVEDVSELFGNSGFGAYDNLKNEGNIIKAIRVENAADKPRSFFDKINEFGKKSGFGGVAYLAQDKGIFKLLNNVDKFNLKENEVIFLCVGKGTQFLKFTGKLRDKLGEEFNIIDKNSFRMCWIVDFPFYEENEDENNPCPVQFSHNPFSMPQGEMDALMNKNPLEILAYQYDFVCNGAELLSGGQRNSKPDVMYKAFEVAGYNKEHVEDKFGGMLSAFKFGAPPHAGSAFGVDRLIMLLLDEEIIRDVILFPLNGKAQDLLMQAPSNVSQAQLDELSLNIDIKEK